MKEKLEGFARGEFEYELSTPHLSVDEIEIRVEAGKQYEGSFVISNSEKKNIKGILYSSNRLLSFNCTDFQGKENIIIYQFDGSYLNPSDNLRGNITIISDCGEILLPFTIYVEAPSISTSIGKIKNLFEFANLARMDWTEAKRVFRSEEFERVIIKNENKYHIIYHNLLKSISTSQALEEFLIAVNKKPRINLAIDKIRLEYEIQNDNFMDKLTLTKDHWGYAEIRVSSDAPFVLLDQKFLWADRFIGNKHQISFTIDINKMHPGNNNGTICIKTVHQTIIVEVLYKNHGQITPKAKENKKLMGLNHDYTRKYLDFRVGRINTSRYIQDTKRLLTVNSIPEESTMAMLINLHLAVVSENKRLAVGLLERLSREEDKLREDSTFEYCAYLYLKALYKKDDETIRSVTDIINKIYLRGNYDFRILWFLLYTDKRYERNRNYKLEDIKDQFDAGCRSPILYYEAICVYNEEPYLLRDLNDFEVHVMNYGIKNNCLTKELTLQYTYLAGRLKNYEPIVYRGLKRLYDLYEKDEILSAICSQLIKGYKKDNKYFDWYRRGVNAQLRITELYEYYMHAVNEDLQDSLPQSLLIYFAYNSRLNDKKQAYLYANIIKYKKNNDNIYQLYYKRMEQFAIKQLEAKNISSSLAILYREFIDKPGNSSLAIYLPEVMFTRELYCNNPNMVSVAVVHNELMEEEIRTLTEGRAYIQIYSSNADIFLIDSLGNRFVVSIDYKLTALLKAEELHGIFIEGDNHPKLLLYLFDHYQRNLVVNKESIELRKQVLLIKGLKESYYIDCLLALIEYYYEYYNGDMLEEYLLKLDLWKVKEAHRIKYLEYMVVRGYYNKALEALSSFGTEGISIKRLLKLCSGWITYSGLDAKEDLLVSLCYYIYSQGKYDETILHYLVKYYNGSTENMINLWQTARDFDQDPYELEERLLAQLLFTESEYKGIFEIFLDYYSKITNHLLVRAFITYYSYKYLVHNMELEDKLFPIIRREQNYEENNISLLAWLKYNSNNKKLTDNDKNFISYNIDRFVRQGIVLPFFKNYQNTVKLPEPIGDRYYVKYKANPQKQVFLNYLIEKNNSKREYITELMPNIFMGIHVKEFVLFYNEELRYYISEELDDHVNITESLLLSYDGTNEAEEDSKYMRINNMLMALDMWDDNTLLDNMADYVEAEHIISECFKPLP